MGWRNVKVEDQRLYLVENYNSKLYTMKSLCKECGVSTKTGYKWVERYNNGGSGALVDKKRAPKNPCRKYSDRDIQIALELKNKYPKYGPKKIRAILLKKYPGRDWPSSTRLYEIFKENHLVCSRKLRRRVPRTHPLGDVNKSNMTWCADFKGGQKCGDGRVVEPFTLTDAYSRYALYCGHLERKNSEEVWKVLSSLFDKYGLPDRIRTDNGPPFASVGAGRLTRLGVRLIKAGVIPEWINPGHPEENGRHERFHKTLKEEVQNPTADTFEEQIKRYEYFLECYNFDRPHEGIGMDFPGNLYTPSTRRWDGYLRSPVYNTENELVRKVGKNGCIYLNRNEFYISSALSGEHVGLENLGFGKYRVFYGPITLGALEKGKGFSIPHAKKTRKR
jgi:transposase InsO family protein